MLSFLHRIADNVSTILHHHSYQSSSKAKCIEKDKEVREHLNEKQIDKAVEDTFPASDPPSFY